MRRAVSIAALGGIAVVAGCQFGASLDPDGGAAGLDGAASADGASGRGDAASSLDAAGSDGAAGDAAPDPDALAGMYATLSDTGLYADISTKTLASDVLEFQPAYELWSDGAAKTRWIKLPAGTQIDTSNMNHWRFPVGTRVWKEFRYESPSGIRLETRLIERTGPDPLDVWVGAFVWRDDGSDADFRPLGATDVRGTNHDVPAEMDCESCHGGEPHWILGFSAVQLSHDLPGESLTSLADSGLLSDPPPGGETYPVPGSATESAALGYIHANCGHCHQPEPAVETACYDLTLLDLRIRVEDQQVTDTATYMTAVDQPLMHWTSEMKGNYEGLTHRIVSGDAQSSAVWFRMSVREAGQSPPLDENQQMPPIFTDEVDSTGLAAVETWINSL